MGEDSDFYIDHPLLNLTIRFNSANLSNDIYYYGENSRDGRPVGPLSPDVRLSDWGLRVDTMMYKFGDIPNKKPIQFCSPKGIH